MLKNCKKQAIMRSKAVKKCTKIEKNKAIYDIKVLSINFKISKS